MSNALATLATRTTMLVGVALCAASLAQTQPAPQFHFGFGLDAEGKIHNVLIYRGDEQIQSLDTCTGDIPRTAESGQLNREDFNFDGYLDLILRTSYNPQTENSFYCVWLYDPNTQRFALSQELSRLTNPRPDPYNRTIIAQTNEPCAGSCYDRQVYKWQNGRLEMVREESLAEDPTVPPESSCRYVLAIKAEKNGTLVETSRQRVDTGGVMCEPHTAW